MSSILKALEKAEESNSGKRIAAEHDMIRARRARPVWILPSAVIGGAAVAALLTFVAMGGFSRHSAPQTASVPTPPAVSAPAPAASPASPASAPAGTAPAAPAPVVAAPVVSPVPVTGNSAAAPVAAAPVKAAGSAAPAGKAVAAVPGAIKGGQGTKTSVQKHQQAAVQQPAAVQAVPVAPSAAPVAAAQAPAAVSGHAELKVSGVAWQGNGESSFAVVNGRGVLQGATVDGYKILEIRQDRVRFQGSNGAFEVPVDEGK
ncbi:hypothetical protein GMLC_25950 [Geomonas limicola]|uniref:Uncharacterized protein n=1 Tax=Geomonas limicola TaxID=2740186 RepID=A0A6V8N8W5_9BACT|nr:hypothetical protein [Geomonas limicola]GFO69016.1 hypothetical protein GMLC_25950 [Geomonas limicola]